MDNSLNIPLILGSSRPDRQSEKAAYYIHKSLEKFPNITTPFVDVRNFHIEYDDDKNIPEFHKIVKEADALILAFPEYNHSFPGKLKSLLDTEFDEYKHKPVAMASASSGQFGGVRAVELLTPVLAVLGLVITGLNIYFPYIKEAFDKSGNPTDPKTNERVEKFLNELIYLTKVIKIGKESLKNRVE